jgi:hypothetical protein
MLEFVKKGLIYCPKKEKDWMHYAFMTPVPVLMGDKIRIFGGIRDEQGRNRITFIDVDAENPSNLLYVHQEPVLDLGQNGCFDDRGLILGSIIKDGDKWRLYYVGFQHVEKVKFYAFSGMAESDDLTNFRRVSETPIVDRKDWMKFIGAIHTVIKEDDKYRVWYACGNGWHYHNNIPYPEYSVYYTESTDGINFDYKINNHIVKPSDNEYRIGRPTVYKTKDKYIMFCSSDGIDKQYRIIYFESKNGIDWARKDNFIKGLDKAESGWDSEMTCYPTLLAYKNKTYCFYNGNGMGATGVGYAELIGNL